MSQHLCCAICVILIGIPIEHEDDVAKIGDKDFVFNGYTFKRFHPAQEGIAVIQSYLNHS